MHQAGPHLKSSGHFSPLRYPGGKGKLAAFVKSIIRINDISDGRYIEPYAGGAAIAWELLLTGVMRRVSINDISRPVFAFWHSVLNEPDPLCKLIYDTPISVSEWDRQKNIVRHSSDMGLLQLGFAFFYLNRTNRSGILNGGIIGGRDQSGPWKMDARYNRDELIFRILKIASLRSRIDLTNQDAVEFIQTNESRFAKDSLLYIDPPYYEKGRYLYFDAYSENDHATVAQTIRTLGHTKWIVSYDDVYPIRALYYDVPWLQYSLNYSARTSGKGKELMYFSPGLVVPKIAGPLQELARAIPASAN